MIEQWAYIHNFPYEVSNLGRVRHSKTKRLLNRVVKRGYYTVSLSVRGHKWTKKVSRLVYEAWVGDLIPGMVIDHIDHNKLNDVRDNLQQSQNMQRIPRHA